MGPATRQGIVDAMDVRRVNQPEDLFDRGVRGVVWHWTAGAKGFIEAERAVYNFLASNAGDVIDGNHSIASQVMYDWQNDVGASHTKNMNTGWIGISIDAMAGAQQRNPVVWGSNPMTWAGIDAMLAVTKEVCEEYNVPVSRWTTLSHAEVQPTLGVAQNQKWDMTLLPGDTNAFQDPVDIGDKLRARMMGAGVELPPTGGNPESIVLTDGEYTVNVNGTVTLTRRG